MKTPGAVAPARAPPAARGTSRGGPGLKDPGDDLVLELAVASNSKSIVTFNQRDFGLAERFGIAIVEPAEFLRKLGE